MFCCGKKSDVKDTNQSGTIAAAQEVAKDLGDAAAANASAAKAVIEQKASHAGEKAFEIKDALTDKVGEEKEKLSEALGKAIEKKDIIKDESKEDLDKRLQSFHDILRDSDADKLDEPDKQESNVEKLLKKFSKPS